MDTSALGYFIPCGGRTFRAVLVLDDYIRTPISGLTIKDVDNLLIMLAKGNPQVHMDLTPEPEKESATPEKQE